MPLQPIIKTDDLTEKTDVSDNDYIIGVDLTESDESKATFKAKAANVRGKDTISIDTIADMKLREGSFDGQSAILNGFHIANDGGGGSFNWDATYIHAVNDLDGIIVYVTGVSVGAWIREKKDHIRIKEAGAVGDNATNNGGLINDVIQYAKLNGKLRVVIDEGVFRYDEQIVFNYDGIIQGLGNQVSQLRYDGNETDAFVPNSQNATYKDFAIISGSGSHVNGWGTPTPETSNGNSGTVVMNLLVQGFTNGAGFRNQDTWNSRYYNCKAFICDIGYLLGDPIGNAVHNSIVYFHCIANSCTTAGVQVKQLTSTSFIGGDMSECGIGIWLSNAAYGFEALGLYSEFCDNAIKIDGGQNRAIKIGSCRLGLNTGTGEAVIDINGGQEIIVEGCYFEEGDIGIKAGYDATITELTTNNNYFFADVVTPTDYSTNMLLTAISSLGVTSNSIGWINKENGSQHTFATSTDTKDDGMERHVTKRASRIPDTTHVQDIGSYDVPDQSFVWIASNADNFTGMVMASIGDDMVIAALNKGTKTVLQQSAGFTAGDARLEYSSSDDGLWRIVSDYGDAVTRSTNWIVIRSS